MGWKGKGTGEDVGEGKPGLLTVRIVRTILKTIQSEDGAERNSIMTKSSDDDCYMPGYPSLINLLTHTLSTQTSSPPLQNLTFPPTKKNPKTAVNAQTPANTAFISPYPIVSLNFPLTKGPIVNPKLQVILFKP